MGDHGSRFSLSNFYRIDIYNGRCSWNVVDAEPSTSTIPPSSRERRLAGRWREGGGGADGGGGEEARGPDTGNERDEERKRNRGKERKMCVGYTHILMAERRERGWLSMRGVVAPPPPSSDQAETTFGVADPHTSFSPPQPPFARCLFEPSRAKPSQTNQPAS